jgi:hypothetical protein
VLPPGFSIKPIETDEDRRLYPGAVQSVFNRSALVVQDEFLKQALSCVPELNLLAWSDHYEIAAFCTVWIDPVNYYTKFESVGTVPSFQKRGYTCTALQAVACGASVGPVHIREYPRVGRHEQSVDAQRDESTGHERANVPSGVEVGAHHCRSGRRGANSSGASGRGDSVSTATAGVIKQLSCSKTPRQNPYHLPKPAFRIPSLTSAAESVSKRKAM